MDPNKNPRIKNLEDEVKILKNEIQQILLDIREQYLNYQNPFNVEPRLDERKIPTARLTEEPVPKVHKLDNAEKDARPGLISLPDKEEQESLSRSPEPELQAERGDSGGDGPVFKVDNKVEKRNNGQQKAVDLATIAGLTQWVDHTTQRVGKQRTEAIVEGLNIMEHLTPAIEKFLLKFIQVSEAKEPEQVTTKDYLSVLSQLESLLGYGNSSEMALISILSDGNGRGNG